MSPPSPPSRSPRRLVALVLLSAVCLSTLLLAASWSVRSEARSRDSNHARGRIAFSFADREGFSYALVGARSSTVSGTSMENLERLKDEYDRDFLWFSIEGDGYVVLDEDVVRKAKEIVAPMNELGERQGRLGGEQSHIGGKQTRIGARQTRIGARMAALSTRLAALSLEGIEDSQRDEIQDELHELERQMEDLTRQQEPLARQQEALGRRQEEMGRQMERLSARVTDEMRRLADDAIDDGKAKRVRD